MAKIKFREERCKGCRLCNTVCHKGAIIMSESINEIGYHPATVKEKEKCTGCALCALVCPDLVIEIWEEEMVI